MASVRNEEQITIEDSRQDEEEVGGETDAETDASIEVDAIKTVITIEDSKQDEEEDGRETDAETDASIEVDMKTVDNESNVVAIDNVLDDQLDEKCEMERRFAIIDGNNRSLPWFASPRRNLITWQTLP